MCGIAGFVGPPDHELLSAMTERIVHRGPDGEGRVETGRASLGHRRLSIIDLEHGAQPFSNAAGDRHLAYNGEVYNFRELRAELEAKGHAFHTSCDTEVVLAAYEEWGTACVERFNGMWAFALLDERQGELVLCRDHLGIKPLYFAEADGRLLFASEIKALLAHPGLECRVDEERLAEYLLVGLHDHDDRTFFAGIRQVLPATVVSVPLDAPPRAGGPGDAHECRQHRYWEPRLSRSAAPDPAVFRSRFERAVQRRLVADVTVGTCLSGGLDSSSIVCVMSAQLRDKVPDSSSMGEQLRTFSAVFDGDPIDEQAYIEPVLATSGAASAYVRPTSDELFGDLPLLVWHQDEPMVSSGPYAQYRVMQLAKGSAKVLLDGQGGDELLAGYVPYHYVYLRQLAAERKGELLAREARAAGDLLAPLARARLTDRRRGRVDPAVYCRPLLGDPARAAAARAADRRSRRDLKARLAQDLTTYSLPSLLRYEDRNSMAWSIESRPPFLDQELVELVLSLPEEAIIRDGWSRWILREALAGTLPDVVRLRRKKIGFTTPEIRWLRRERAIVQGIFRSPSFCSRSYWDGPSIARAFHAVCDGDLEESPFFWRVLNAEAWLRVFHGPVPLAPLGQRPRRSIQAAGDAEAAALVGGEAPSWTSVQANEGRHVFSCGPDGRTVYGRAPVRTARIEEGDDLDRIVMDSVLSVSGGRLGLEPGDLVAVSEKAVAISQGRSFPVREITPSLLAKGLSRFVRRSPAGIGLGIPETMQLALDEAGRRRILAAAAAGALGRAVGRKGDFYRVAGGRVAAIDGPTAGTLPPFDTHAKLPPEDPDGVSERLAKQLSEEAGGQVKVAIVDANDRGAAVLGASRGVDRKLVAWLFGDNPLGQGSEQTPVCLIRPMGRIKVDRPKG
ncbi:MAG TPA: asparagine synthase (glutamine-hydrolyzing) [Acidimicrobiales bacterium]|nr:asparagine synthase (glutamine-hydrolyzing) [Acidimicrobiales bacterium]